MIGKKNKTTKRERMMGSAREKRRYDLPLNRASGTGFLLILIALMTFLGMMAMATSFALSAMTDRWSSGLENRMTVEIPARDMNGNLVDGASVDAMADRAARFLSAHPAVAESERMADDNIRKLVEPWLGAAVLNDGGIPLPALISVRLRPEADKEAIDYIKSKLQEIAPQIRLDTHEGWLKDLLRFTGAMQLAAMILTLVIGATTVIAVAGAVRSRLAIHKAEVELLHIIGASDGYITKQFQRHSLILALQGGLAGAILGVAAILLTGWVSGEMGVAILPDFRLSHAQMAMLAAAPVLAGLIAAITARVTVLRVLARFP